MFLGSQDTLMGNQTASSLSLVYTHEIPEHTIQNGHQRRLLREKAETVKRILMMSDNAIQDLKKSSPASRSPPWLLPWGSMGKGYGLVCGEAGYPPTILHMHCVSWTVDVSRPDKATSLACHSQTEAVTSWGRVWDTGDNKLGIIQQWTFKTAC